MKKYYVNKNADAKSNHEVHVEGCPYSPRLENRIDLGYFYNCEDAVRAAKKIYRIADGCNHCSKPCHTT
ncbi:MAG: hypothetical protein ACI8ZM_004713 [Crocinitomix sp.]|jgi:hypothetical protein